MVESVESTIDVRLVASSLTVDRLVSSFDGVLVNTGVMYLL